MIDWLINPRTRLSGDGDTRRALAILAEAVASGDLDLREVEDELCALCGSRGDLRAYFNRQLAEMTR